MNEHLQTLWPEGPSLLEVLKTDAESTGEAVLLAVHQPMRFQKRRVGGAADEGVVVDERELLEYLLAESPDGRVIVPIVGWPGSGKSHVVRWLDVHLRHRQDAGTRRIIRIPKGRSLKGVLEDLLAEVQGPEYEQLRVELRQARERIDPERAAHHLCEMLAQEVEALSRRASALEREQKGTDWTKVQRDFGNPRLLPTVLRNQRLRNEHFVDRADGHPGVVRRLIAQLYEERVGAAVDDRTHVFVPDDLRFSDAIAREELGQDVIRAMEQVDRDANRARAAAVLNAALDVAKQQLLGLSPTITDLFLKIREQLFRDGLELVFLVEDFVVLSGLQGQLLQVMIQEAFRDGRQVRCTMRSVIAYTPGHLQTETVLTRAGFEYVIPDGDEAEDATGLRIRKLVGAYLNAARVGQAGLARALGEAADVSALDRQWVPRALEPEDDDARRAMEAFGRVDGVPLHPFTRESIAAFAEEACRKDQRLVFNPRFIIRGILDRVLSQRADFCAGAFPAAPFRPASSAVPVESAVLEWVQRSVPQSLQSRYITFLTYWAYGMSPGELGALLRTVGATFGLPAPPGSIQHEEAAPAATSRERPAQPVTTPVAPTRDVPTPPAPSRWEERLDAWRRGQALNQADWRTLRKEILGPTLLGAIDWDWLACRRREIDRRNWAEQIWIDGATSNPVSEEAAATVVARASERLDLVRGQQVASELTALADAHEREGGWDVDDCEEALARTCAFVERHAPRVRAYLFGRPLGTSRPWSPVPPVVQGLALGARVLQVPGRKASSPTDLVPTLFAVVPDPPAAADASDRWEQARQAFARMRREVEGRPTWSKILLEEAGARQGGGESVHAVDVARLKADLDDVLARWQFEWQEPSLSPAQKQRGSPLALTDPSIIEPLRRLDVALPQEVARIRTWIALVREHLPEDLDLAAFGQAFSRTLEALRSSTTGGLSHPDARRLTALLEDLLRVPLKAVISDAERIVPEIPRGDLLRLLGRAASDVRGPSERFIAGSTEALSIVERQLCQRVAVTTDPQADAVRGLVAELTALDGALKEAQL